MEERALSQNSGVCATPVPEPRTHSTENYENQGNLPEIGN